MLKWFSMMTMVLALTHCPSLYAGEISATDDSDTIYSEKVAAANERLSAGSSNFTVQDILNSLEGESDYFFVLDQYARWGFAVTRGEHQSITYISSRLEAPVTCDSPGERFLGGAVWNEQVPFTTTTGTISHVELIVVEASSGNVKRGIVDIDNTTLSYIYDSYHIELLTSVLEGCGIQGF